ncbi:condensation protein [Streptomyces sp. NPDC059816]|uniref:phthiocerol/phthiodiolone dimycocerosyl transferase family protein n=1 Tax=Streptomyces sp. NPDC059816 TaxID=3346960 RepID=UPI0036578B8E
MSTSRDLEPAEALLAGVDQQVAVSSTIEGPLDLLALDEAVGRLAEEEPVLLARLEAGTSGLTLSLPNRPAPPRLHRGICGDEALTAPFPLDGPLLRVTVVPGPDGVHEVVTAVHHAVSDGASVLELHRRLWDAYTARLRGEPPRPAGRRCDGLPEPAGRWFAGVIGPDRLAAYLAARAAGMPSRRAATLCATARGESGAHLGRVELAGESYAAFRDVARECGATPHTLLCAAALGVIRERIPVPGDLPMSCVSAVDLRTRVTPAVPRDRLVMGAGPVATLTSHSPGDDARDRAPEILGQLRDALRDGVPELELLAARHVMAELTGEAPAAVTLSVSNLAGRPLRLGLPPGHTASRLRLFSQPPGPFPVVLATSTPQGLGLDTAFPRAWFGADEAAAFTAGLDRSLKRLAAAATPASTTRVVPRRTSGAGDE